MRIGFVGAGSIANAHLKNLASFPDVEIAAVTDVDPARAAQVAETYGATVYPDHEAMMREARLDAVYLCIPPFAHGAPERSALEHGIPFYVEKPLALDPELPESIADAVERSGLITAVGFQLRYIDTVETLRRRLEGRALAMVNGHYFCPLVQTPWWRQRDRSGGQLVEQVIHIVDLIRYITGDEVARLYCQEALRVHGQVPAMDIADVTVTSYTMKSGAIGSLVQSCALPSGWQAGVDVIASGIAASWTTGELRLTTAEGVESIKSTTGNPMAAADRAFVDSVASGSAAGLKSTYQDALKTHRVVMAAMRSVKEGRPVSL